MDVRIVIDQVRPRTPTGLPAKAVVGEHVAVSADIFKDGHDVLGAQVRWRSEKDSDWHTAALVHRLNDEWTGTMTPSTNGRYEFVVDAWTDVYATWRHKLEVKLAAGQDVGVELAEGVLFFERRAAQAKGDTQKKLASVARMLANDALDYASRTVSATTREVAALVDRPGVDDHITSSAEMPLWVDRQRALFSTWYELFPRSYGGLKGSTEQLDYVAAMNFDVVYLPPIHPIGTSFRKGRNNTLDPKPDDVGSPWGIGNTDGGHTAIHGDLGTIDDFKGLIARAAELGMEVAMDYALQCSPDHPWVSEHPEWFNHRPDGSIAYAENPPKKYQDIYPINFWPENEADRKALWNECREILEYWADHGIRIFRVDNPHTKPMAFWQWVIPEIQKNYPDALFLAEAFTRPKVMAKLAEVGFSQSYTYYTWRQTKWELTEYLLEVAHGPKADYMRPNFWPNTPDILAHPLRNAPISAFKIRLALAATMVPSYGIYSGFELGENKPMSESNEEYFESEKYEVKHRNFHSTVSIADYVAKVNDIRHRHPALQELRNVTFHGADNDGVICFSKAASAGEDVVLVVVNIDPHSAQEATLHLNLSAIGVRSDEQFEVFDEMSRRTFYWWGSNPYVRLDPEEPAHIMKVVPRQ